MNELYDRWRPSWANVLLTGGALVCSWSVVLYAAYFCLDTYLPAAQKAAIRSALYSKPPVDESPTTEKPVSVDDHKEAEHFLARAVELSEDGMVDEAVLELRNALRKNPGSADALFEYGKILAEKGRTRAAIDSFEAAVAANPQLVGAWLYLGRTQLRLGYFDAAEKCAKTVRDLAPNQPEAHLISGICARAAGKNEVAAEVVERALSLEITDPNTYLMAATYFYQIKNYARSAECYEASLKLDPTSIDAQIGQAYLLGAQEQYDAAHKRIQRVIETAPENIKAASCLAEIHAMRGNIDMAIQEYERIKALDAAPPFMTRVRHAELLMNTGKTDEGAGILKQILADDPENMTAHLLMANMYLKLRLFSSAQEHVNRILRINPEHIRAQKTLTRTYLMQQRYDEALSTAESILAINENQLDVLLLAAQAQYRLGTVDEAIQTYLHANGMFPQSVLPLLRLADVYREQGRISQSVAAYRSVLAIAPDDPLATNNLAALLLETGSNIEEALEMSSRIRQRFPRNPSVADTNGWALYHSGQFEKARQVLEFAAGYEPGNPTFHYHLGMTLVQLQDTTNARVHLSRALEISDTFSGADKARKALQTIE